MSTHEEWVDIRIQLRDAQRFIAQTTEAGASTQRLGTEAEVAGAKANRGGRGFQMFGRHAAAMTKGGVLGGIRRIGSGYFHAAKGILAAGAAFAGYEGAKKAIENTDALAQSTIRLTKNSKFDVETASRWAAVATARGIDANRLGQTLAKLSKTVEGGLHGQKASVAVWEQMGITQQDLMNSGKDMPGFLGLIADRFQKMGPGTQRTALAQQLFGRSWQTLIPLLRDGSGALNKQLDLAHKYGAEFNDAGLGGVEGFIQKQREMKFATLGLQISFAKFLIPALVWLISKFNLAVLWFRKHHEVTDILRGALKALGFVLGGLSRLIGSNIVSARAFGVALVFLIGLGVATKLIRWGTLLFETAKTLKIVTAAQWLWNFAMEANPIILIVTALIGLGVGLTIAYKKVAWFRNGVNAIFGGIKVAVTWVIDFIKKHWKQLLIGFAGPFGIAAVLIIKNWNRIIGAARTAINWITKAWGNGMKFIGGMFRWVWNAAKGMWDGVVAGGKAAINFLISLFNVGIDAINAITPGDINLPFGITIPGIPDIPKIPLLAEGGFIRRFGSAIVGERGPEVVTLPAGARVDPIPKRSGNQQAARVDRSHLVERFAKAIHLTIPVMLNHKEVGRAQSRYVDDEEARA